MKEKLSSNIKIGIILFYLLIPITLFAQVNKESNEPHWWEIVSGIIAIPVTCFGLAYSYILIKKTKVETRKLELELIEKEKGVNNTLEQQKTIEKTFLINPILESRHIQFLLLRFALFYVVLQFLEIFESIFQFLIVAIGIGINNIFGYDIENSWIIYPLAILIKYPEIYYWMIIVGFGLPLFRDINKLLKINIKNFFMPWKK